jgi:hypothetical protein
MLRIMCRKFDVVLYTNTGEDAMEFKSFDIDAPEVEKWLRAGHQSVVRKIMGVELLESPEAPHAD